MGTFSTIGFEHFVANAFILPAAAFFGADISGWKLLFWNLAVVGFGNYIGGVCFFGVLFWYAHMWRPSQKFFFYNLFGSTKKRIAITKGRRAERGANIESEEIPHQTSAHSEHNPVRQGNQAYHQYELATEGTLQPTVVAPGRSNFQL